MPDGVVFDPASKGTQAFIDFATEMVERIEETMRLDLLRFISCSFMGVICSLSLTARAGQKVHFCNVEQLDRPSNGELLVHFGPPDPAFGSRGKFVHDAVTQERREVRMASESTTLLLKPGEQAFMSDGHHVSCTIDLEQQGPSLKAQFKLSVCMPHTPCTATIRAFEFTTVDE